MRGKPGSASRHTPDMRCRNTGAGRRVAVRAGSVPITNHPTNENDPVACRAAGRDGRPSRSGRRLGRRFGTGARRVARVERRRDRCLAQRTIGRIRRFMGGLVPFPFFFRTLCTAQLRPYAPQSLSACRGGNLADPATGAVSWGAMTALREAHVSGSVSGGVLPGTFALGAEAGLGEFEADPAADVRGGRFGSILPNAGSATACVSAEAPGSCAEAGPFLQPCRAVGDTTPASGASIPTIGPSMRRSPNVGRASFADGVVRRGSFRAGASQCDGSRGLLADGRSALQPGMGRTAQSDALLARERRPLSAGSARWRFDPPDSPWRLTTTLAGAWGHSSLSSSDWYDASSPQPDYYRYLPGFLDNPEAAETVREAWTGGDPLVTQIDWEELYRANDLRGDSSAAYVVASDVSRRKSVQLACLRVLLTIRRHG